MAHSTNRNKHNVRTYYFFDSWGGLWAGCIPQHPKARNFGPCYTAREVPLAEQVQLGLLQAGHFPSDSPLTRAYKQDRVVARGGWNYLRR